MSGLPPASRTRGCPVVRGVGASLALTAATAWALERLGVLRNPLTGVEETLIGHPWSVVAGLAGVAVSCRLLDRRSSASLAPPDASPAGTRL